MHLGGVITPKQCLAQPVSAKPGFCVDCSLMFTYSYFIAKDAYKAIVGSQVLTVFALLIAKVDKPSFYSTVYVIDPGKTFAYSVTPIRCLTDETESISRIQGVP